MDASRENLLGYWWKVGLIVGDTEHMSFPHDALIGESWKKTWLDMMLRLLQIGPKLSDITRAFLKASWIMEVVFI